MIRSNGGEVEIKGTTQEILADISCLVESILTNKVASKEYLQFAVDIGSKSKDERAELLKDALLDFCNKLVSEVIGE